MNVHLTISPETEVIDRLLLGKKKDRILCLNQNPSLYCILKDILANSNIELIQYQGNWPISSEQLAELEVELIIIDPFIDDLPGLAVLDHFQSCDEQNMPSCIILTRTDDINCAVLAMQRGAVDFLTRPIHEERLRHSIFRSLERNNLSKENAELKHKLDVIHHGQRLLNLQEKSQLFKRGLQNLLFHSKSEAGLISHNAQVVASGNLSHLECAIIESLPAPHTPFLELNPSEIHSTFSKYRVAIILAINPKDFIILFKKENFLPSELDDSRLINRYLATALRSLQRYDSAKTEARADHLTKLFNAQAFEEALQQALTEAKSETQPLSVLFMDIDHFKQVNDNHGHLLGSALLQEFSEVMMRSLRGSPITARYGGDEFVILLPHLNMQAAKNVAERIRKNIEEHHFLKREQLGLRLTTSIGVSSFPDHGIDAKTLLELADRAMYVGKNASRNAVYTAEDLYIRLPKKN